MKLFFTILYIGLSCITYSQNILTGKVTNTNNEPLIGVDIYTPNLHIGTTTDLDGNFSFKNLPNGTITMVFSFTGYKSVAKSVEFEGKEVELNIVLEESVFRMDEVIISIPFNKLQSQNVVKVEHKTIKQLQRDGATTLAEGISNIAGVSQVSTGVSIGKPVIRGLSGNRVLVYTQGVRLENQQFGDEHGLGLNDNGVESVEIIKGPASLLYGSDALGGVLYFVPEKFANSNTIESTISQKYITNTLGSNSKFGFKASSDEWKFLTTASYSSNSDYKISENKRVTNSRFNEFDVKSGLGFNHKNFSSDIRFNFNTITIGLPEEIGEQTKAVTPQLPYQEVDNYIVSSHNHFYLKSSKLDVNIGYIANNRKEFEEEHGEEHEEEGMHEEEHEEEHLEPALHMKLKTLNYDVKYHLPSINEFESIIGVQGLTQRNTNFGEELLIPDASVNDIGAFITVSKQWDKHTIQGGMRFDNRNIRSKKHVIEEHHHEEDEAHEEDEERVFEAIDKSFNSFTASLGYKTTFFNTLATRINFATGFRAPNLAELTSNGVHHGTNRFEIGNKNLSNEQNYQLDISLEYGNKHIEFFANGFYNTINDYIFITPTGEINGDDNVFVYVQDDAKLYGGEFGFHLHPHPLDWLHLESSFEMVIGEQNNGNYLPLIPANQLNNTLRAEFELKNWLNNGYSSIILESVFDQNNVSTFETVTKGYNILHASLGGNLQLGKTKFSLSLNINNVLDTSYISHLSRLKSDGIQNIGRSIILGISFYI